MKFKKTVLKNGLRIVTIPMEDNPSVTVLMMVEAGSKYETKSINGLSHFLEHMVFKGTTKRPKAILISKELDSIGANYNAFTSQETTGYYAKADKKHFEKILDIVSDMYLNPIFDKEEIEKEKGVIIEEIRMYNDLPQRKVQEDFLELLFGDQPAGWEIAGTEENIRSFTREQFIDYRNKHYVSSATTVIISGNFNEKKAIKGVEKIFSNISNGKKDKKEKVIEKQDKPAIKIRYKETDQSHLVIGCRTFPITDKRVPTMLVLSTILGSGMSSRLFSKMRDQLGICYYVNASHDLFTDHGDLAISAGVDNSRVVEGVKGIIEECRRLKEEIITEEELRKAKDYLAGTIMLSLETSDARAEYCGSQEIIKGKIESPDELIKKIENVKADEVRELARETFVNSKLNMAIIGKYKDKDLFLPHLTF